MQRSRCKYFWRLIGEEFFYLLYLTQGHKPWKILPGSKDFLTSLYTIANLGSAASVKTNPATFRSFEAVPALLHSFSGFLKVYKYSRVHQSGVDHVSCKSSGSDGIQTMGLTEAPQPARRGTRDASHQIGKRLAAFWCSVYLTCCPLTNAYSVLILQLDSCSKYSNTDPALARKIF